MKRWHLLRSLFLAVVGTLLLNNGKGISVSPCHLADSLRYARQYDLALAKYTDLLKKEQQCAKQGIDEILKIRAAAFQEYERGKAFETSADLKASETAYIHALQINPTYKEAQQALQRVLELQESKQAENKSSEIFNSVLALANAGFYTEARDKLKKIIEENPDAKLTAELESFLRGRIPFLQEPRHQLDIVLNTDLPITLIVTILCILWLLLLVWNSTKLRLYIQDFEKGGTKLEIGQGLAAMVKEQFKNIDSQGGISSPQLVAGPIEKIQTPIDVSSVVPSLRFFSLFTDILSRLPFLPQNTHILSGYIQPPSENGVGITLILQKHPQEVVANCTIWQKDFDRKINFNLDDLEQTAIYYRLTEAAAIWTLFQLQEAGKINIKKSISVNSWQSYACFRAGFYWRQQNDKEKAQSLFLKALALDKENHFALCNLGIINTEEATQKRDYERAIAHLKQARNIAVHLKQEKKEKIFKDPVWYKSQYQLAATHLYNKNFGIAQIEAWRLLQEIANASKALKFSKSSTYLNKKHKSIQKKENKACLDFLEKIQPMAVIMYADILVKLKLIKTSENFIKSIDKQQLHDRSQYNLACYYSGLGQQESRSQKRQDYYEQALQHLENAFELRNQTLLSWAQKDPSLIGLRNDSNVKDNFQKLLEKYSSNS